MHPRVGRAGLETLGGVETQEKGGRACTGRQRSLWRIDSCGDQAGGAGLTGGAEQAPCEARTACACGPPRTRAEEVWRKETTQLIKMKTPLKVGFSVVVAPFRCSVAECDEQKFCPGAGGSRGHSPVGCAELWVYEPLSLNRGSVMISNNRNVKWS